MTLRIAMMGTGEFALPTLRGLYGSDHELVGVFTQPDRSGQGHHEHVNPIKQFAEGHALPVYQPDNVNSAEGLEMMRATRAELCITAAYGQILSAELLGIPRLGVVNVHASLLPKYRGAAPIPYAILGGESKTGITIFQIDPRLDAGPILGTAETDIGASETAGQLEERLAELAVPLTLRVIGEIESATSRPVTQDASKATRALRLKKTAGMIDWTKSPAEINRHCRAMQPWPTPYTFLHSPGAEPVRLIVLEAIPCPAASSADPGTVLSGEGQLIVQAGGGAVEIARLQPAGKRAMSADEFLRGRPVPPGSRLGTPPSAG